MNYTRLELPSKISNTKTKIIIEFCIVLPLVSIIIGSLVSKIFIYTISDNYIASNKSDNQRTNIISSSVKSNTDKKVNSANTKSSKSFQGIIKYYYLQGGIYSSKQNGDNAVKNLKLDGINATLMSDGKLFRIILEFSNNGATFKDYQSSLKSKGYDTLVKEGTLLVGCKANSTYVQRYAESIYKIVELQLDAVNKKGLNKKEFNENYLKYVNNMNLNYRKALDEKTNSNIKNELNKFQKQFTAYVNKFNENIGKNNTAYISNISSEMMLLRNCTIFSK